MAGMNCWAVIGPVAWSRSHTRTEIFVADGQPKDH